MLIGIDVKHRNGQIDSVSTNLLDDANNKDARRQLHAVLIPEVLVERQSLAVLVFERRCMNIHVHEFIDGPLRECAMGRSDTNALESAEVLLQR